MTRARPFLLLLLLTGWVLTAGIPAGAAPVTAESGAPPGARWVWPLAAPHPVLRQFEAPSHRYGPGHRGIDIGASADATVVAVEDGVVRFAGMVAGRGTVSIVHAGGLASTYEPVAATVASGQRVAAGDVIGQLSRAADGGHHCGAQPCLHLGARTGLDYRDPLPLLGARGPSVLLAWDARGSTSRSVPRTALMRGGGPVPLLAGASPR